MDQTGAHRSKFAGIRLDRILPHHNFRGVRIERHQFLQRPGKKHLRRVVVRQLHPIPHSMGRMRLAERTGHRHVVIDHQIEPSRAGIGQGNFAPRCETFPGATP